MSESLPRVGYLVSLYPARSHTFIEREIEQLESRGFQVKRYSQRRMPDAEIMTEDEQAECDRTYTLYPLQAAKLLQAHLKCFLSSPLLYLSLLVRMMRWGRLGSVGAGKALAYFVQGMVLTRQIQQDKVDVLHIHFANSAAYVGACAASFCNIPMGVSLHGRSDFDSPGIDTVRWFTEQASFIRCVSEYGKAQVYRNVDREHWDKIFVAYCGLPDAITARQPQVPLALPVPRAIVVGRISVEKGQLLLVDMMARLRDRGISLNVVLIGDGELRHALEAEIERQQLQSSFELLGSQPSSAVLEEMAGSSLLICPSLMEGLPQVLMEAMAMGVPVVAPGMTGIPELVRPGETGLLFPPSDVETLCDQVERLLADPGLQQQLASNAQQLLAERFRMQTTVTPLAERLGAVQGQVDGS